MNIIKSTKKIISLLLAIVFISTNTAYSLERTLRIPLQQVEERLAKVISKYPTNLGRIAPAPEERDENRRFCFVIAGTGLQGSSVAYVLANQKDTRKITLVDKDIERAKKLAESLPIAKDKIKVLQADLSKPDSLRELFQKSDVVIGAADYALNAELARVAAETGAHFVDMGGNTEVVLKELAYADIAIENGACIIPDMGLDPGIGDLLAFAGIQEMDIVNYVKIRVGGLPTAASKAFNNPLRYMLVFYIFGLINEYTGEALAIRDGKVVAIPTFGERESFEINGEQYEAFPTSGGTSTLTFTLMNGEFRGKVKNLDYMTIRYPGHADIIQAFIKMGFFDETKVSLENKEARPFEFFSRLAKKRKEETLFNKKNIHEAMEYMGILSNDPIQFNEISVSPRQFFAQLAEIALNFPGEKDKVIIFVSVSGEKNGKPKTIEYYYDSSMAGAYGSQFSEMARTTGFPVAITALMLARGQIKYVGAAGPEHFVPTGLLIKELRKMGVGINKRVIEGASAQKLEEWLEFKDIIVLLTDKIMEDLKYTGDMQNLIVEISSSGIYIRYYKGRGELSTDNILLEDLDTKTKDATEKFIKAILSNKKANSCKINFSRGAIRENIEEKLLSAAGFGEIVKARKERRQYIANELAKFVKVYTKDTEITVENAKAILVLDKEIYSVVIDISSIAEHFGLPKEDFLPRLKEVFKEYGAKIKIDAVSTAITALPAPVVDFIYNEIMKKTTIENHGVLVRDEDGYSWVKRENSDSLKSIHIISSLYKITDPKSALIIKSSL